MAERVPPARQALFVGAVVALCLLAAEGVARLALPERPAPERNLYRFAADPDLLYELKPHGVWGDRRVNGQGLMADRDYAVPKPAGVYRIASVGDSVAFLSTGKNYAAFLQQRLAALDSPARRFEVLDFSVVGYNSLQERLTIRDKVVGFQPDLILLGYCANDHEFNHGADPFDQEFHPSRLGMRIHSRGFQFLQGRYYRLLAARSGKVPDYAHVEELFATLRDLRGRAGIDALVLFLPLLNGDPRAGTGEVAEPMRIARRQGLAFLAPPDVLGRADPAPLRLSPDDTLHLNEAGHRVIADRVFAAIRDRLPAP